MIIYHLIKALMYDERFDNESFIRWKYRNHLWQKLGSEKINMKMLAQKRCKCTFAGNLETNCTAGII